MIVLTVLRGTFSALEILLYPSPDWYFPIILSEICLVRFFAFMLVGFLAREGFQAWVSCHSLIGHRWSSFSLSCDLNWLHQYRWVIVKGVNTCAYVLNWTEIKICFHFDMLFTVMSLTSCRLHHISCVSLFFLVGLWPRWLLALISTLDCSLCFRLWILQREMLSEYKTVTSVKGRKSMTIYISNFV